MAVSTAATVHRETGCRSTTADNNTPLVSVALGTITLPCVAVEYS